MKSLKVGIIGAAAISAGKLMEIILRHPNAALHSCVSESSPGKPLHTSHPQLRGRVEMDFDAFDLRKLGECDVVFSCKRAGDSFAYVDEVLGAGAKLIDLSGDYRLVPHEKFETWYKVPHARTGRLAEAVYGMPELHRERIRKTRLVANPGCYTTTAILGLVPLVAAGYAGAAPLIIDAISGVSGAGRGAKAENLFISVAENVRAYRVGNHQHTPEIEQELTAVAPGRNPVTALFVPHVGPYKVGIMVNAYLRPADTAGLSNEVLYECLRARYAEEPFVRVYEPGSLPQVEYVAGTNFCDVSATFDKRTGTIVAISVADNLVKGAAGQAVQNMNIMFGLPETAGLLA